MLVGGTGEIVKPFLASEFTHTVLAKIVLGSIDDSGKILVEGMDKFPLFMERFTFAIVFCASLTIITRTSFLVGTICIEMKLRSTNVALHAVGVLLRFINLCGTKVGSRSRNPFC